MDKTIIICEDCSKFGCGRSISAEDCMNFSPKADYAARKAEFCKSCAHETAAKALAEQVKSLEEKLAAVRKAHEIEHECRIRTVAAMERHSDGAWRWIGDGSDDLGSMAGGMAVLIGAGDLRQFAAAQAESPILLAIYTTDDGRIKSVVERDEDGDPVDREVDATAIIAHVDELVSRLNHTTGVLVENNIEAAGKSIKLKEAQSEIERLNKRIESQRELIRTTPAAALAAIAKGINAPLACGHELDCWDDSVPGQEGCVWCERDELRTKIAAAQDEYWQLHKVGSERLASAQAENEQLRSRINRAQARLDANPVENVNYLALSADLRGEIGRIGGAPQYDSDDVLRARDEVRVERVRQAIVQNYMTADDIELARAVLAAADRKG
jgi:hypothetical protein